MPNTYVQFDFKWVLSSQKLDDLKTGKRLLLKKNLCQTHEGDWALKLLRKTEAKSVSFSLMLERMNYRPYHVHMIKMNINLYTLKPKQHILQKSIVETLRRRSIVDVNLESYIQEIFENNTRSVISGNIFIKDKFHPKVSETLAEIMTKAKDELSKNVSTLCCSGLASDVLLKCSCDIFAAHRVILASRSPYFAELFKNTEELKIYINDLKPDVLKSMLYFIYSAKTEELTQELAFDLITASIAYKLKDLKTICVNYLISIISVENAIAIYNLAVETDEELKIHTLKYMSSNFKSLESSNEWQNLLKENPVLATQILTGIVKSSD